MRSKVTRSPSKRSPSARAQSPHTPERCDSGGKRDGKPSPTNELTRQQSRKSPTSCLQPYNPKPRRSGSLWWKVLSVFFLSIVALLLCLNSLLHHKKFLRRILLPDHPPKMTRVLPHYTPLLRAFKMGEYAECETLPNVTYNTGDGIGRHLPVPLTYWREECQCTPVHNFVILSMQRSGSGWFETFLNSHPNISSHGEVFARHHRGRNATDILQRLDTVFNLDWVSSAAKNTCTSAVGFKWMLNQGALEFHEQIVPYFQRHHVSVLLLLRRNVLRRLVSILANAHDRKMRGKDHISHTNNASEAQALAAFRPSLNTRHLPENLQRVQDSADEALLAFNRTRLLVVFYEEVVRNRTILADVQRFLGVPPLTLNSSQVKIHSRPMRETIANFEQVKARLQGTPFAQFVLDDYSTEDSVYRGAQGPEAAGRSSAAGPAAAPASGSAAASDAAAPAAATAGAPGAAAAAAVRALSDGNGTVAVGSPAGGGGGASAGVLEAAGNLAEAMGASREAEGTQSMPAQSSSHRLAMASGEQRQPANGGVAMATSGTSEGQTQAAAEGQGAPGGGLAEEQQGGALSGGSGVGEQGLSARREDEKTGMSATQRKQGEEEEKHTAGSEEDAGQPSEAGANREELPRRLEPPRRENQAEQGREVAGGRAGEAEHVLQGRDGEGGERVLQEQRAEAQEAAGRRLADGGGGRKAASTKKKRKSPRKKKSPPKKKRRNKSPKKKKKSASSRKLLSTVP